MSRGDTLPMQGFRGVLAWLAGALVFVACGVVAVVLLVPDALELFEEKIPDRPPLLRPIKWWQALLILSAIFGIPALLVWTLFVSSRG